MVEHQPSKLDTWVRFPSPALGFRDCAEAGNILFHTFVTGANLYIMHEWLSGGAPPCQGGGRGFDPRLVLANTKKGHLDRCPFFVFGAQPCPVGAIGDGVFRLF